jgi:hypothetical protein
MKLHRKFKRGDYVTWTLDKTPYFGTVVAVDKQGRVAKVRGNSGIVYAPSLEWLKKVDS